MTNHDRAEEGVADDAARLLAEWFAELGYLEQADAAQIVSDAFGDALIWTTALGTRAIRQDVLDALRSLMTQQEPLVYFASWDQNEQRQVEDLHPGAD